MQFKEDFLHFIWQFKLFNAQRLHCYPDGDLQVLSPGIRNRNAGPDFSYARLRMENTLWVGHVEIHLKASDWLLHRHQKDPAYDNVILHVVYEADVPIYRRDGSLIPILVLKGCFDQLLLLNYQSLINSIGFFPCEKQVGQVDPLIINSVLTRQLVDRLEYKKTEILAVLDQHKGDWEKTFYIFLAMSFGFKVNTFPFGFLAEHLDLQVIRKHRDQPLQVNALIFGQAGFLNRNFEDTYPAMLSREYAFFRKKYKLEPMDVSLWKFLRMRPQNFPTVRLAQFAAVLLKLDHLFFNVLDFTDFMDYYALFEQLDIDFYWRHHYHFNKVAADVVHLQIGRASIENIVINTICPFIYVYGKYTGQENYIEKAIELLEYLPSEKNAVLDKYRSAGLLMENAFQSQAVLQLNKNYCNQKKCLNCNIGIKILKK